ncbi:hypothetical protein HPB48_007567 [Haemaphysalis longicornis]|uniref:Uncharacterized protein n=1 Tax=Haemaphysalis longicornis TaxID=44386 RepID=A0A9J6FEM0_HAELO|nr:hypothetical protein HPB48_007567 [Haemaphysalis longicornis]
MVAVFISENFELVSLTLSTRHMTERHTGAAIMNEFQRCLEEFNMVGKEVCAVTDAGSNMKRAASLACTEHHLCVGHGLHNLVIKDGFGSVPRLHDLLVNCRDIVKTVHCCGTRPLLWAGPTQYMHISIPFSRRFGGTLWCFYAEMKT